MPVKCARYLIQNSTYLPLGWGGRRAAPSTPLAASPARICCYRDKQIMRLSWRSESALGPKASLCAAFDRPSLALLDQERRRPFQRPSQPQTRSASDKVLFVVLDDDGDKAVSAVSAVFCFSRKHDRADDHCPIWPVENAPIIGPATGQGLRRASSHVPEHAKRVLWLVLIIKTMTGAARHAQHPTEEPSRPSIVFPEVSQKSAARSHETRAQVPPCCQGPPPGLSK